MSTAQADLESVRAGVPAVIWTPLYAHAPEGTELARSGHSMVVLDDKLLAFGGTRDGPAGTQMLGEVLSLDVGPEGLERLTHPGGGAQWLRLEFEDEEMQWSMERYNHACIPMIQDTAPLGASEDAQLGVIIVGGNDDSHSPVGEGLEISIRHNTH